MPSSPPTTDADDHQRLQMIAVIMDNLMGLINQDDEVYTGLSRVAHITCGDLFRHCYLYVLFVYYF